LLLQLEYLAAAQIRHTRRVGAAASLGEANYRRAFGGTDRTTIVRVQKSSHSSMRRWLS
jgi:hypothetical protein